MAADPVEQKLIAFAHRLIDQRAARIIVEPQQPASGFWFGGGNLAVGPDGFLYLVGRYRNAGDSRSGTALGDRGLELALFRSKDRGKSFEKILALRKADLDVGHRKVLSIEGAAIMWSDGNVRLYVSTEKSNVGYPPAIAEHLKPGTGVWSIDLLESDSLEGLKGSTPVTVLESDDPRFIQVKDPVLADSGSLLVFCSHPFCWSSSNTGAARILADGTIDSSSVDFEMVPRGPAWDVAMTRGTAILPVTIGTGTLELPVELMFYDGGECVRLLTQHARAVERPRGHSCEALGGLAWRRAGTSDWDRLSTIEPMFVSPHGTGCSRYVDVLATDEGFYATWQQSQPDGSQPLVLNFVSREESGRMLS